MTAISTVADEDGTPEDGAPAAGKLDDGTRRSLARVFLTSAVVGATATGGYEIWRGTGPLAVIFVAISGAAVGAFLPLAMGLLVFLLLWIVEAVVGLILLPLVLLALFLPRSLALRVLGWNERIEQVLIASGIGLVDQIVRGWRALVKARKDNGGAENDAK